MPPRAPVNRGKEPIIAVTVKSAVSRVIDSIREKQTAHSTPSDLNTETLQKQHLPNGWERLDNIPQWMQGGAHLAPNIRPESLQHAIRLSGTNHVITSDHALTKPQLEKLTTDYRRATDAMGKSFPDGVAMHVPKHFIPKNALAYAVRREGHRVFYMRPSFAKNANEDRHYAANKAYRERQNKASESRNKYTGHGGTKGQPLIDPNAAIQGHTMPASEVLGNMRTYTMLHEMGHIIDFNNGHTGSRLAAAMTHNSGTFWKENKGQLSRYGNSEAAEGYAEASAQYFLGGKGSSAVADKYAQYYGW